MFFSRIDLGQYPELPFNYHEPMTTVTKDQKDYRVYYTNARDYHIVIVEEYDGSGSYYASFKDDDFMRDGELNPELDLPVILDLIREEFRINSISTFRLSLKQTVNDIFNPNNNLDANLPSP